MLLTVHYEVSIVLSLYFLSYIKLALAVSQIASDNREKAIRTDHVCVNQFSSCCSFSNNAEWPENKIKYESGQEIHSASSHTVGDTPRCIIARWLKLYLCLVILIFKRLKYVQNVLKHDLLMQMIYSNRMKWT